MCYSIGVPGVTVVRRLRDSDAILLALKGGIRSDEGAIR